MPFVSNMDNQDEQKSPSQGPISPVGGGASVQLSPSSGVPSSAMGTGKPQAPMAGGQFASLNQYLNANQGQAEPLAGKLTQGIGQQYNTLSGQNTATLNDIGNQVTSNAIPGANATLAAEAANPVSFANNPSNISSFQKLLGATYSGPASAESTNQYQAQQNAINSAIAQGKTATQMEGGRENLLQQNEATPTTGVTALNSAILSQSPAALKTVETAYDPYANLLTGLSSGAQSINKNIAQTQGDVTQANTKANQQIADQINAENAAINSQLSNTQNTVNQYNNGQANYAQMLGGLQANLAPFEARPGAGDFGWTPTAYAPVIGAPTAATIATPEQFQQAQAFQSLISGLNLPVSAPVLNPADAALAGTYNVPNGIPPTETQIVSSPDFQNAVMQMENRINQTEGQHGATGTSQGNAQAWNNLLAYLHPFDPTFFAPPIQ